MNSMKASGQENRDNSPAQSQPSILTRLIATGFFSGYIPWASGTFGTLVGVIVYLIPGFEHPLVLSVMILIAFFAGVVTSAHIAQHVGHILTRTAEITKEIFQSKTHETADPSIVVIDEILGMWIALLFLPKTVLAVVIAFFAFRGFDIIKPFPARQLERIPNGWGIMLDDAVAGVYANLSTHLALYLIAAFLPGLL